MTKRMKQVMITVASLAALALGGSALAQASTSQNAAPEPKAAETDTVQSGDQTTLDTPASAAKANKLKKYHHNKAAKKATPDTGSAAETPGIETPEAAGSESATPSDGTGGHADTAGNVDHQFDGTE